MTQVNDNATLIVGGGYYYTATAGTEAPADLLNPTSPWSSVGHTSLEDIFSVSSEGGEATQVGTLQNRALRTSYSSRQETFTFTVQEFTTKNLKLYYGSNSSEGADGMIQVPTQPIPTTAAFLAVFIDGENEFAFYAPKAEILRADDLSIGDTESLAGLPLGVKPLAHGNNKWTYAVTPLGTTTGG